MTTKPRSNPRTRELARIHVLAAQAGLDTADKDPNCAYRRMLQAVGRQTSAGKLDAPGRRKVINHLQRAVGNKGRPNAAKARAAQISKIGALLADAGRTWAYVRQTMVPSICKKDRLEFCGPADLRKLITALELDARRRLEPQLKAALTANNRTWQWATEAAVLAGVLTPTQRLTRSAHAMSVVLRQLENQPC